MKNLKVGLITMLFTVGTSVPAFAKPNIILAMEVKKVKIKDGKEVISDVKATQPGDVLLYTIKVSNKGDAPALEVEPKGDIPSNTSYIAEQNNTKHQRLFTIDNVSYKDVPTITIKENGKNITKNAPTDMYKKIKWVIKKVNSNETYNLTYKVRVK